MIKAHKADQVRPSNKNVVHTPNSNICWIDESATSAFEEQTGHKKKLDFNFFRGIIKYGRIMNDSEAYSAGKQHYRHEFLFPKHEELLTQRRRY